uniref:Uncharacterized protein n=2 Tax=Timema TaxID=61471 RepID=A0A7R9ISA0_9NEOP|nr:unnamed protein product [Timema bartmani]CAD7463671.1 unnamed protein product [Timema tahoe]
MWRVSPVPVTLSIYFFNWTNPHELKQPGAKPKLVEMGPYAFREYHEKVDIVWNDDNNTVSYRQVRWWQFDPDQSRGSLDDLVTTVNVVPAVRTHSCYIYLSLSSTPAKLGQLAPVVP